ncbi:prolyl oligopeptidase family serine peptidase [Lentzea sp. HUAS12]|uniref:prolyl oligopeptidase family serine peptidase n=1 Tax=Lentzea sp. HUAS12 TaxID=2951806 RepID=UPI00209DA235|nr:prolyl oligopeptidase family serine peptidase [Lentzea sp. HUAS12]USX53813.1 prolyl oligopeptidase family serine peptidase [Lentzea sp. HUAS12]
MATAIASREGVSLRSLFDAVPSPRGTYVAGAVMLDGDTVGPWIVYEVVSGKPLFSTPPAPHIHAQPGWLPDESGFWMADRTPDGLHRLRFHPVAPGTATRPELVLPAEQVAVSHPALTAQISPDGRRALLVSEPHEHVALGLLDLGTLTLSPFLPDGWTGECDGSWLDDDTYVARVTWDGSRGQVEAIPVATSQDLTTWRTLVPEGDGFLNWAGVVGGRLYVGDLVDVSQRVRMADLDGGSAAVLPLPGPCDLPSMMISRCIRPTEAFAFTHTTFTQAPALMWHDPETGELVRARPPAAELSGVVVERGFATGRDGTRVPYFLVRRADLDRGNPLPCLVHAYGGFNLSLLPRFPGEYVPFIEAGGIFVQASLRGGGEYGRAWHDAGRLANKQNVFDDLAAVAQALIDEGVSSPDHLAFQGESNGGLLAGVAAVRQPHLWRAVAPVSPLLDLMEAFPDTPEASMMRAVVHEDYGDVDDPEDARTTFAWSPYHNIEPGIAHPAVYQVFGESDPACRPFHGRKFTARLREADAGGRPIHLRVWRHTGHVALDPAQAATYTAEWLSFLMNQTGLRHPGAVHKGGSA